MTPTMPSTPSSQEKEKEIVRYTISIDLDIPCTEKEREMGYHIKHVLMPIVEKLEYFRNKYHAKITIKNNIEETK